MILEKLFGGEFYPAEIVVPKSERYKELLNKVSELQNRLSEEVSEEEYSQIEKLHDMVSELGELCAEEYFKYGFSSGIMLLMESYQFIRKLEDES